VAEVKTEPLKAASEPLTVEERVRQALDLLFDVVRKDKSVTDALLKLAPIVAQLMDENDKLRTEAKESDRKYTVLHQQLDGDRPCPFRHLDQVIMIPTDLLSAPRNSPEIRSLPLFVVQSVHPNDGPVVTWSVLVKKHGGDDEYGTVRAVQVHQLRLVATHNDPVNYKL